MEKLSEKATFLKTTYTVLLNNLDESTERLWGKMNLLQMVEHMTEYVQIASGKIPMQIITAEENLEKMQNFLKSDKPFRENTPNVLLPDNPIPVKNPNKEAAILELQQEIDYFFYVYSTESDKAIPNPFFGILNYDLQVQLLYKHATHHLRQFGVVV